MIWSMRISKWSDCILETPCVIMDVCVRTNFPVCSIEPASLWRPGTVIWTRLSYINCRGRTGCVHINEVLLYLLYRLRLALMAQFQRCHLYRPPTCFLTETWIDPFWLGLSRYGKNKVTRYTVHLILPRFYGGIFHGIRESQLATKQYREIWIETNKKMEVECVDQGDDQLQDACFINSSSSLSRSSSAIVNFFSSSYSASAQSVASEEFDQSIGLLNGLIFQSLRIQNGILMYGKLMVYFFDLNLVFLDFKDGKEECERHSSGNAPPGSTEQLLIWDGQSRLLIRSGQILLPLSLVSSCLHVVSSA